MGSEEEDDDDDDDDDDEDDEHSENDETANDNDAKKSQSPSLKTDSKKKKKVSKGVLKDFEDAISEGAGATESSVRVVDEYADYDSSDEEEVRNTVCWIDDRTFNNKCSSGAFQHTPIILIALPIVYGRRLHLADSYEL